MSDKKKPENEGQYMSMGLSLGMCLGISIGMAVGAAFGNIPIGMCFGVSIGMCLGIGIGSVIDAKKKNKSDDTTDDPQIEEDKE